MCVQAARFLFLVLACFLVQRAPWLNRSSPKCLFKTQEQFIKAHCLRLLPGQDLKKEIVRLCSEKNILAGCIVSSVGSLKAINLRLSGSKDFLKKLENFEILSLNGTVSVHGLHLHLALSDHRGNAMGGHLMDENIIFTTCELIILELDSFTFTRPEDSQTGFKELKIEKLSAK